jgi:aminoglycoside phosphotransferase (APT) family kinase protein
VQQILDTPSVRAHGAGEQMVVKRILAGNEDTTVMLAGGQSHPECKVVLRAAYRPRATQRVRHNAEVLQSLGESQLPFAVPALLATSDHEQGVFISAESCLPGSVLLSVSAGGAKQAYMRKAVEKWNAFRRAHTTDSTLEDHEYERLIGSAFAKIQRFTSSEDEKRIAQLDVLLRRALTGRKWPLGPTHGDFKVGNILVDGRGDVCGVIDWDCWEPRGLPLMDVMTLCTYEDARELKRHFRESIVRGLFQSEWSGFHNELLEGCRSDYELSSHELNALKVAFWAINLRDRIHWLALATEKEAFRHLSEPTEYALRLFERG